MPIVTIRGQMGSGAPDIGKLAATRLKADYVDREIIAEIATHVKRSPDDVAKKETPPTKFMERIEESLQHFPVVGGTEGMHLPVYLPTWEIPLDDDRYLKSLESVIKKLAESPPIVIRGRGSQFILKDYPETLHVLVVAPLALRVKRIVDSMHVPEPQAKQLIERSDKAGAEFIRRYFRAELESPVNYDLVINTRTLTYEEAAELIEQAASLITGKKK